jgi:hypothetical protein
MSWLYSQVLVAEYSEANSLAGAQSAPLSGNPTPQAYCASDRMKAFSRLSRFGMTFAPLTDDHGEAVLTWFLAGFLAKTSARQERERALTEPEADCGKKWRGLLVKWDHAMFSSKTVLCSEQADSHVVLKDLAAMGYDARWGVLGAVDAGAPHKRDRMWIRAERRNLLSHAEHRRLGWREQQSPCAQETYGELMANAMLNAERPTGRYDRTDSVASRVQLAADYQPREADHG